MRKSPYCKLITELCENTEYFETSQYTNTQKIEKTPVTKSKKIIKITSPDEPKRGRGRPRKNLSNKL